MSEGTVTSPHALGASADSPGMLAWRTFLTAHATIIRALEAELEADQDLALSDFDVLAQLHIAGGTLRMRDLADRVLLSRSGLTRRIDRLEGSGYVERTACETDRRGSYARLTAAGRDRLTNALPVHLRGIEHHFIEPLNAQELATIGETLAKVVPPDRRAG
ncbi:MAG TPA: MarR family transcriptional regulator [Candidatus Limnocylindrales bacterium]|nr:MarR family transcriptional regulator [Candidatus Limnocylindrales bacterium]